MLSQVGLLFWKIGSVNQWEITEILFEIVI